MPSTACSDECVVLMARRHAPDGSENLTKMPRTYLLHPGLTSRLRDSLSTSSSITISVAGLESRQQPLTQMRYAYPDQSRQSSLREFSLQIDR